VLYYSSLEIRNQAVHSMPLKLENRQCNKTNRIEFMGASSTNT